jgi:hypothetical protein
MPRARAGRAAPSGMRPASRPLVLILLAAVVLSLTIPASSAERRSEKSRGGGARDRDRSDRSAARERKAAAAAEREADAAAAPARPPAAPKPPAAPRPPPPELPPWARNTSAFSWTGAGTAAAAAAAPAAANTTPPTPPTPTTPLAFTYPEVASAFDPNAHNNDSPISWAMPALLDRPSLAVSLGGAGARAAALSWGWSRALARFGVLSRARHLTSTQTSAWLAAPLAYRQAADSDDAFYGPWLPPENLGPTPADLAKTLPAGSWGERVAGKSLTGLFGGGLGGGGPNNDAPAGSVSPWSAGVASVVLEPFGLDSSGSPSALGTVSANSSGRAAAALKGRDLSSAAADRPFLLDAFRATRDGGLFGLFGAALGGGGGGGGGARGGGSAPASASSSSSSSSAASKADRPPVFDPARNGGRPFPVIVASAVAGGSGAGGGGSSSSGGGGSRDAAATPSPSSSSSSPFRPFEITPLYAGLPGTHPNDPRLLSGVLVETFGANSRLRPSFVAAAKSAGQQAWEADQRRRLAAGDAAVKASVAARAAVAAAAASSNQTSVDAITAAAAAVPSELLPERPASMPFLASLPSSSAIELQLQSPASRGAPPLSLAAVLGATTAAPAAERRDPREQEAYLASPGSLNGQWFGLADGAATDGTAVLAALRRAPTHLIACVAAADSPDLASSEWAAKEPSVAALFGAYPASAPPLFRNKLTPAALNAASQVFARAEYERFYQAMRRAWLGGDDFAAEVAGFREGPSAPLRLGPLQTGRTSAPVFRLRLRVLPNARAGVEGGRDVEVLFVVSARAGLWEARLPADVQSFVQGGRQVLGSPTWQYPHLPTAAATALQPEVVALLSQQADWQLRQAVDSVIEFVGDAKAEDARARYVQDARAALRTRGQPGGGN